MGTLFRIFPQTATDNVSMPAEIVEVSSPAGTVGPRPSDDRMFVIFPLDKPKEYGMHKDELGQPHVFLPPWRGAIHEPAIPDAQGDFLHFDSTHKTVTTETGKSGMTDYLAESELRANRFKLGKMRRKKPYAQRYRESRNPIPEISSNH